MFIDNNPTESVCPRLQNKKAKCPKADIKKALEGIELSYRTISDLRFVLYDVCWYCMRKNKKIK